MRVAAISLLALRTLLLSPVIAFGHPAFAADLKFEIGGQTISVIGDLAGFSLDIQQRNIESGLDIATFTWSNPVATVPPPLTLSWSQPSHDMAGIWTPDFSAARTISPDWREIGKILHSMLTAQAPVISLFGNDDSNRYTVAISDAINPIALDARVREEDALIHYSIDLFTERHPKLKIFSLQIRFDRRNVPFYAAVKDVSDWWANLPGYEPAFVPDIARQPMYSTWYSYHQNIATDRMLEEVKAAKKNWVSRPSSSMTVGRPWTAAAATLTQATGSPSDCRT